MQNVVHRISKNLFVLLNSMSPSLEVISANIPNMVICYKFYSKKIKKHLFIMFG